MGRLLHATTVAPSASSASASVCGSGTKAVTSPGRTAKAYNAALTDFVAEARGYGWQARRVTDRAELDAALCECLDSETPYFLDVVVAPQENCYPMIPAGCGHHEMVLGVGRDWG